MEVRKLKEISEKLYFKDRSGILLSKTSFLIFNSLTLVDRSKKEFKEHLGKLKSTLTKLEQSLSKARDKAKKLNIDIDIIEQQSLKLTKDIDVLRGQTEQVFPKN